jgi:hypothetical protein
VSRYFLIYVEIICNILGSTATFYNILLKLERPLGQCTSETNKGDHVPGGLFRGKNFHRVESMSSKKKCSKSLLVKIGASSKQACHLLKIYFDRDPLRLEQRTL